MKGVSQKMEGASMCFLFIVLTVCVLSLAYMITYETHKHFHYKLHAEMKEGVK